MDGKQFLNKDIKELNLNSLQNTKLIACNKKKKKFNHY